MKLTSGEKKVCDEYNRQDETGHVRCFECPLNLSTGRRDFTCYANIDGRTSEARGLKRYKEGDDTCEAWEGKAEG